MTTKDLKGQNLGRYHIIEPLGQGGMASIYKAYDTSLERNVAIKIIRADIVEGNEDEFLKRFQREARALAQLDHPYILKVLDYGERDGIPYLVMPFVPGGTLKEKLGVAIPYQQAAALLAPIARALEYAHEQHIIHRDVKPANILISQSGAPLLSDFGIAKIIAGSGSTQLTATGVGIGTPDYMAPEQWMGITGPATDIYSLGVVYYEMITGHRLYIADTPAAIMLKHLRDPLPRPSTYIPGLPDLVENVLFKALAKEPEDRYHSMGAFAAALEELIITETIAAAPRLQSVATVAQPRNPPPNAATRQPEDPSRSLAPPAPKKIETWQIMLLALTGLIVIVLLCILAGGTFFASRSLLNPKQSTAAPGQTINTAATAAAATASPAANSTISPTDSPELTASATPLQSIEGFPEDIPFLKENNGDLGTSTGQGGKVFFFSSKLPVAELTDFYLNGMKANGWEIMNEVTQGQSKIWYFTKSDKRMIMISLTQTNRGTGIQVVIPLTK